MYSIEYNKEINNSSQFSNIKSLTIDKDDILMMKYIDILYKGDKCLVSLYLKYLKFCRAKKKEIDEFTILNDSESNQKVIASIINCDWLINKNSLEINSEEYGKRKNVFQDEISFLKDSKRLCDIHRCQLMQYYIDTFDKNMINDNKVLMK